MTIEGSADLSLEKAEVIGILIIAALLVFAFSCVLVPMLTAGHGEHAEHGVHEAHVHSAEHGETTAESAEAHLPQGEHTATTAYTETHG